MCNKESWKNYDELSKEEQPYVDGINHMIDKMNPNLEEQGLSMSGFDLPIWIENHDEYDEVIVSEMKRYRDKLSSKRRWQEDPSFLEEVDAVISHIQDAIKSERCGETRKAQQEIHEIIASYGRESFFVNPITKNFAFCGTAAFHDKDEDEMEPQQREPLTFFRCRTGKFQKREDLYPLPSSKLSFCSAQRYSLAGIPCLYLATTTYCCWMELGRPEEFSASSYMPIESKKKLPPRILNLAFSQQQMHNLGKDSRAAYLLFPLVMAVSVAVKNPRADANFRPEYTISHLVMRCLREFGIAGVAYRSSRIDDVLGLLHTINLAIPLFDREKIFSDFLITDPGTFSPQKRLCKEKQDASSPQKHLCKEKQDAFGLSYLNKFRTEEKTDSYSIACYGHRVDYRDTSFSDIDNYLAGRTYYPMNNEK